MNFPTVAAILSAEEGLTPEQKARAKEADLIVIPEGLAERCHNCRFIKDNYCSHPKMELPIKDPANECCALWDNSQIDRTKPV
jgi:hypothetical protein